MDLQAQIKDASRQVNEFIRRDIDGLRGSMEPLLCDILDYGLLAGGKRVRPLLVLMAGGICGKCDAGLLRLGVAFEYLHAATLFHDDIIDRADFRRGRESVVKKFGPDAAILSGDFLHTRSMLLVTEGVGVEGLSKFYSATSAMVDGEFLQLRNASEYNLSELDYYKAVMGKTGVLIAAACELGAMYAGATVEQCQALKRYGEKLGSAFQIIDDLLDYQGEPEVTGKAVGNDLVEGKMTLPLILALTNATAKKLQDAERLQEIIGDPKLRSSCFEEVYGLVEKYNGFSEARSYAERDVASACAELDIFTAGSREQTTLIGLAHYVLARKG